MSSPFTDQSKLSEVLEYADAFSDGGEPNGLVYNIINSLPSSITTVKELKDNNTCLEKVLDSLPKNITTVKELKDNYTSLDNVLDYIEEPKSLQSQGGKRRYRRSSKKRKGSKKSKKSKKNRRKSKRISRR